MHYTLNTYIITYTRSMNSFVRQWCDCNILSKGDLFDIFGIEQRSNEKWKDDNNLIVSVKINWIRWSDCGDWFHCVISGLVTSVVIHEISFKYFNLMSCIKWVLNSHCGRRECERFESFHQSTKIDYYIPHSVLERVTFWSLWYLNS